MATRDARQTKFAQPVTLESPRSRTINGISSNTGITFVSVLNADYIINKSNAVFSELLNKIYRANYILSVKSTFLVFKLNLFALTDMCFLTR